MLESYTACRKLLNVTEYLNAFIAGMLCSQPRRDAPESKKILTDFSVALLSVGAAT